MPVLRRGEGLGVGRQVVTRPGDAAPRPGYGRPKGFQRTIGDNPTAGWLFLRRQRVADLGQAEGSRVNGKQRMRFGQLKPGKALIAGERKEPVQYRLRQPNAILLGSGKVKPACGLAVVATQALADELGHEGRGCLSIGTPSPTGEQRPQKIRLPSKSCRLHRRTPKGVCRHPPRAGRPGVV